MTPIFHFIRLTQGLCAIVDEDDFKELSKYIWCVTGTTNHYAMRRCKKTLKTIIMHRQITKCKKGMMVDHINGFSLDNRKCNLRVCTAQQNTYNKRIAPKYEKTSMFRGVSKIKKTGKWKAAIGYKTVYYNLGHHEDEISAAKAYDRAAIKYFGEYAILNYPPPGDT